MKTIKELGYKNYVANVYHTITPGNNSPFSVALWYKSKTGKIKNIYFTRVQTAIAAETKAIEWIEQFKDADKRAELEKIERRRANAQSSASQYFQHGDIVYASWGYEQTNINFYRVEKVTAKTVSIVEIYAQTVEGSTYSHGMADEVIPLNEVKENGKQFTLTVRADGSLSRGGSHKYFRKWSGNALYRSWYH